MRNFVFFDSTWAIGEHDKIIQISGGFMGVLHYDELGGMLEFIKDDGFYPEYEDKLTHLIFSIAKNHYFVDGNKRSAIAVGAYFMQVNGLAAIVPIFITDMEYIILCVADGIISKGQLKEIMIEFIRYGEMSEISKLLVIESVIEYNRREQERNTT